MNAGIDNTTSACNVTFNKDINGEVTIKYKTSSESGWDKLYVYVDGIEHDVISGETEGYYTIDFVAKNEEFIELTNNLAELVATANPADVEALLATVCPKCGKTVEEALKEKIASIGEKITVRRFVRYEGNTATYIHNGKIGVLLSTSTADEVLAKDICLHIASSAPEFVSRADIPASVIEEETRVEMGKEDLANKPEQIRAKIVEGRVNKLMAQKCLVEQPFVKNPDQTIEQLISGKFSIVKFERYVLGEGLEKRNENFADEVMSQIAR